MAASNRPRRPGPRSGGSRNPTGRPRRVASQTHPVDESAPDEPIADEPAEDVPAEDVSAQHVSGEGGAEPPEDDLDAAAPEDRRGKPVTTILLTVAIVLMLGIGIAEVVYLTRDSSETISSERPIVTGEVSHRAAVEAAARSTEEILSTSFESYDDQVEQATSKMTDTFAEEYRQTSDGIRDQFVDQRTRLQVKAVGQSVVQASPEEVQALLFLDQYVEKRVDGEPTTDFAQYRALVTVVRTDQGWLVSDIETQ